VSEIPPVNLDEYQAWAKKVLPAMSYDYIAGGAGDEATVRANREAFAKWRIRYRVLRGIQKVELGTTVVGSPVSMPILLSPVAFQRLCCDEGEVESAVAARDAGTIITLSTLSTRTIEDFGRAAGTWWFQLYMYADRAITEDLIRRAEAAGASAIVVTVDTPLLGRREADERNGFALPAGIEQVNLIESARMMSREKDAASGSQLAAYIHGLWNPSLSWNDIDWVQSLTRLPIGLKGIVDPEDAGLAVQHGCRFIVVSNHGGRQLDQSVASLDALPAIVQAVDGAVEVLLDGGLRRGTDVIKALALGARAVMIGRPYVWGLATAKRNGVTGVLELLRAELQLDMLLSGCASLEAISSSLLVSA
jgi:4-hydroxymandelate oxidase